MTSSLIQFLANEEAIRLNDIQKISLSKTEIIWTDWCEIHVIENEALILYNL